MIGKDLFPNGWLLFYPIDSVLCLIENNFMGSHLSILDLRASAIGVLSRKISLVSLCYKFFPTFSSIRFSVSGFVWRSLIHLHLSYVQGDKNRSICILQHLDCKLNIALVPFDENALFSPLDGFNSIVKDQVTIGIWVHFWVFNSIPLMYLHFTVPILCNFLITIVL